MTSWALVKHRGNYKPFASIKVLLRQLGLPKSVWGVRNFWEHWNGQFDLILHDAEKLYRAKAIAIHPRKSSDDQEESKQLNALWATVKSRFRRHTWIKLKEDRAKRPPPPPAPNGFYSRYCRLPQCGIHFITKRKLKHYCCAEHHKKHWSAIRYLRKTKPAKKRLLLKCQFKSCGHLFWATAPRPGAKHIRKFCSPKCASYFHTYKFRAEHPEITNAGVKAIRDRDPQKHRDAVKKWKNDNREKFRAYRRKAARKRKKLNKKMRPVVRKSLLDLLNLIASQNRDIRNRSDAGKVGGLNETALAVNSDQVGAMLPQKHETVELDVFRPLAANDDQVVLRPA